MEYHLMGSVSQIRMKQGCIPKKFCQPDRRKPTSDKTEREFVLKKQRKMVIEQCGKEIEERRTFDTKQLEHRETSFGSSGIDVFSISIIIDRRLSLLVRKHGSPFD